MTLAVLCNGIAYALVSDEVTIGRSSSSGIRVDNNLASRHHCKLRRSADEVRLADNGSSNGTFLNGKRLGRKEVVLKAGDLITIGRSELSIISVDESRIHRPALPRMHDGAEITKTIANQVDASTKEP